MIRHALFAALLVAATPAIAQEAQPPAEKVADESTQKPEPKPEEIQQFSSTNEAGTTTFSYYLDQDGQMVKHGKYRAFYPNGKQRREVNYVHGRPHGRDQWWHANGRIWMDFTVKNGKRDGAYQEFTSRGKRKSLKIYKDGKVVRNTDKR